MHVASKAQEWRASWLIPFIAMLGVAGTGIFSFSSGVFMDEMIHEFGWNRTQFSSGLTAYVIVGLIGLPLLGRAIDRFGPRAVALTGLAPAIITMAMLGLANGNIWQWRLLVAIQAIGLLIVNVPVWLTAVVGRFHASRGLAIAIALAGSGVSGAVWPMLSAFFVQNLGWRLAFPALALCWGAVMVPLTTLFFHGTADRVPPPARSTRPPLPPVAPFLLTRTFLCLTASGGLFIGATYALILHFVPILRWSGHDLSTAAMIAGVTGACSIVGRIVTGYLLDLLPTRMLGCSIFLLPIGTSALLLNAGGNTTAAIGAAALLGLSAGAESDVLTYMASRRFDHAIFGSIYSVIQAVFAVMSVGASIVAGAMFDAANSYVPVLVAVIPMVAVGAALLALVPFSAQNRPGQRRETDAPLTGHAVLSD